MVYFQTKNRNLGKFWKMEDFVVLYGHFVYFTAILYILRPFVIHILRVIWFIFPRSGIGIVPRNIWQPC
jgi:hypothetical protein